MAEVKTQTYLTRRNGVYYFRRVIPEDLRAGYSNKKELVWSLRTRGAKRARELAQIEALKTTQEFAHRRRLLTSSPVTSLSQEEIDRIAELWLVHALKADDEWRAEGISDDDFEWLSHDITARTEEAAHNYARGRKGAVHQYIDDFLPSLGLTVDRKSETYQQLAAAFLKAGKRIVDTQRARLAGEVIDTPKVEPLIISSAVSPELGTLSAVCEYWEKQPAKKGGEKSRSAIADGRTAIRKFREMVGDLPPAKIGKEHIATLRDKMLEDGSAPATINRTRGLLAAMFACALESGRVERNPFLGMEKLAVEESGEETPYTIHELQTLFNSPVFASNARPLHGLGEAAFWMPLIGLYTGARMSEIAQLYTPDIGNQDGMDYFLIKHDPATKRTTKDRKTRRVPIHPDLIRMGFLDYVKATREAGHMQLFPLLKVTRKGGKLSEKWGAWWRNYVREELGITRIPQPFHGLRHSFTEYGRDSNIPYEHRMRIEGHALNTVGDKRYGKGLFPLAPLHESIKLLTFKGLNLSHLYKR